MPSRNDSRSAGVNSWAVGGAAGAALVVAGATIVDGVGRGGVVVGAAEAAPTDINTNARVFRIDFMTLLPLYARRSRRGTGCRQRSWRAPATGTVDGSIVVNRSGFAIFLEEDRPVEIDDAA